MYRINFRITLFINCITQNIKHLFTRFDGSLHSSLQYNLQETDIFYLHVLHWNGSYWNFKPHILENYAMDF